MYEGDVSDELKCQGFDIPTYVDTSLKVTSISMPISASGKPLAAPSQESPTASAQTPDSATSVCSPKVMAKHAESLKIDSPSRKSNTEHAKEGGEVVDSLQKQPGSQVPKHSNKEQHLDVSAQLQKS